MSAASSGPKSDKDLTAELRLRPERPPVTRLSRKVLLTLAGVSSAVILGASFWALQGRGGSGPGPELYDTNARTRADGLAALPRDYTGLRPTIPKLGPPLPGDLGRPILNAQNAGGAIDPTLRRIEQEKEAARVSKLFAQTDVHQRLIAIGGAASGSETANPISPSASPPIDAKPTKNAAQIMQDQKLAFMNAPIDRRTLSPDRLQKPPSPYVLQAGAIIPAALVTGIRSDLPGPITAQVTEDVYDSPTGRFLLIPQGAKLIGVYDSQIAFGQSRLLLVWTRLILPDGRSIVLERQPGADTQGYSGLEDQVDDHWAKLFQAAVLSTVLGVGTQLGSNGNQNSIVQALRQGSADSMNQVGQKVVGKNLDIQPTLTIRPGFPVNVIVTRDLVLAPYPQ